MTKDKAQSLTNKANEFLLNKKILNIEFTIDDCGGVGVEIKTDTSIMRIEPNICCCAQPEIIIE